MARRGRGWLDEPGRAAIGTTNGANASMIYVARTDTGVVIVDLGWAHATRALRDALVRVGATTDDVVAVLLTHAHRDHVGAWRAVARAPFYVGADEIPLLAGEARPRGWVPRLAERVRRTRMPRGVALHAIARDTALVFGRDTIRAFPMPGHTAGSVAYLFRGVLFVGDGASQRHGGQLRVARSSYADDVRQARRSLGLVLDGLPAGTVRILCTAHARCATYTPAVRAAVTVP